MYIKSGIAQQKCCTKDKIFIKLVMKLIRNVGKKYVVCIMQNRGFIPLSVKFYFALGPQQGLLIVYYKICPSFPFENPGSDNV